MTELDPDWPGNWEDEDEPKTDAIPGSLNVESLTKIIESDPQKEVFRYSNWGSLMAVLFIPTTILLIIAIIQMVVVDNLQVTYEGGHCHK